MPGAAPMRRGLPGLRAEARAPVEEEKSGGSGKPTGEEREEAMAVRYVIRTVDEDGIDLVDEPVRIDDRRAAWAEAKRRIATDPDLKTVVLDRDTGAILWQSDPAVPPRYLVASADRTVVYAIDDADFPIEVLSDHKEKDDAWTAFYDAVAASADELVFIFDVSEDRRRIVANSDDFDHLRPVRDAA